jgi:hypothetical protein
MLFGILIASCPAKLAVHDMQCSVRLQLEKNYQDARATFDKAAQTLWQRIGTSPLKEYKRMHARMVKAWHVLGGVQRELEQHVDEHCCLSQGSKLPI